MATPIFIGSGFVAKYPEGGGNFWVPLQYILGFREAGIDAYWLELLPGSGDDVLDQSRVATFFARTERMGIGGRAIILYDPDGGGGERHELICPSGLSSDVAWSSMRHGVLINLANSIPAGFRATFAYSVLCDIDPGMMQLWSAEWGMGVGEHDVYLTIGQNIGRPDCPVPTAGVEWHRLWPAVHLPAWPRQSGRGRRYTTVTQWWNGNHGYDVIGGELYDHNKRNSFLEFTDMPRLSELALELAANITPDEVEDRDHLTARGWRLVPPHQVARSPLDYRRYIQSSRGEFGCAKPSCVKLSPGWISDRTICYLASGRPCVVQETGAGRHLPQSRGLQFFTTPDEAVEALRAVERDYDRASREARGLAEEFFATAVVVPKLVDIIGLS